MQNILRFLVLIGIVAAVIYSLNNVKAPLLKSSTAVKYKIILQD